MMKNKLWVILWVIILPLFVEMSAGQQKPSITEELVNNFTKMNNRKIQKIIIHAVGGPPDSTRHFTFGEIINGWNDPEGGSAHYLILREEDGKIYQCVKDKDKAWHAKGHNETSIGIELQGNALWDPFYMDKQMYISLKDLVKYLCDQYEIPMDRKYIIGHEEVNSTGKVDPIGPGPGTLEYKSESYPYFYWEGFMKFLNDKITAEELMEEIEESRKKKKKRSNANQQITTARDPNAMYGPEGYVYSGQELTYTIEVENEGEGIAYGVYITDVLDESLDDSTLEVFDCTRIDYENDISTSANFDWRYNSDMRTLTIFVDDDGEVLSKHGGKFSYRIKVDSNAQSGTVITNYATVYFPSVPETTKTNAIISVIPISTQLTYLGDSSVNQYGSVTLKGQLTTSEGKKVAYKEVIFSVEGATYTATTDVEGIATVSPSIELSPGTYTIQTNFDGDGFYYSPASEAVAEFSVTAPLGGSITGRIEFDLPRIDGHEEVSIRLKNEDKGIIYGITTDEWGWFGIDNLVTGYYVGTITAPGASAYKVEVDVGKELCDLGTITLINGDANGDGVVNDVDFEFLKAAFFKRANDANWEDTSLNSKDGWVNADFNGDGRIDVTDFGFLRVNFGRKIP